MKGVPGGASFFQSPLRHKSRELITDLLRQPVFILFPIAHQPLIFLEIYQAVRNSGRKRGMEGEEMIEFAAFTFSSSWKRVNGAAATGLVGIYPEGDDWGRGRSAYKKHYIHFINVQVKFTGWSREGSERYMVCIMNINRPLVILYHSEQ